MLVTGLGSGDIQVGTGGGSAALAAVSSGYDVKVIGSFSGRNSYDFVARPNIKRAEDLRGKKVGVTSIGGGSWMGALLWLEQLGLDPQRDQITLLAVATNRAKPGAGKRRCRCHGTRRCLQPPSAPEGLTIPRRVHSDLSSR